MTKKLKKILLVTITVIGFAIIIAIRYDLLPAFVKNYYEHKYENAPGITVPDSDAYTPKYK